MANMLRYNSNERLRSPHNPRRRFLGGTMNKMNSSVMKRAAMLALIVLALAPVSTFAQRRWHRSRVVIYQPQSSVIYQTRPRYQSYTYRAYTYGYPQSYYNTYYSNGYGYTEPYYSSPYYSYRYSQPYFANRDTYSWANPTYSYRYSEYQPRYRRNRVRVGIWLR